MRTYRAGDTVEDLCRACKIDRLHSVIAADENGRPVRVQCDYCGSQHNFRGGPTGTAADSPERMPSPDHVRISPNQSVPLVSTRERAAEPIMLDPSDKVDLEMLLRRIIREETGLTMTTPAEKWRGGSMVLRPANPALQEKAWPIESFFHKVVMIRNRLRTLEQQINSLEMPDDAKVRIQSYITGCYGSLTSFNVLFAVEADQFRGSGSE